MSYIKAKELRAEAKKLLAEQAEPLIKNQSRTADETKKLDLIYADIDSKMAEARRLETHEDRNKQFNESRGNGNGPVETRESYRDYETPEKRTERLVNERRAFASFIMSGYAGLNDEERAHMLPEPTAASRRTERRSQDAISNPITAFTANASFLVPQGFQRELEVATKAYGNMLGIARTVDTTSGNPMYWPTQNDTAQQAHVIGESVQVSENDMNLGHVLFGAWKYTSDVIRVSLELEQDSFESIESIVKDAFAIRFGRGLNSDFTNGDGVQKSTGYLPAIAASGAVAITAVGSSAQSGNNGETGANSIGYYDLLALLHSVDPSYRDKPDAKFVFHDQVLLQLRRLQDKYGRPLWQPGIAVGSPDTILNKPYSINQQMPLVSGFAIASGNTTIAFGDWSKFVIRRVKEMTILRLVERYADFGQVGLLAFARYDSQLVDAGTHPINVLKQA